MNYEWDPDKEKSNYKKHRVKFADAVGVFEDENAITIDDELEKEDRFITIGMDFLSRILVVVYTFRDIVSRSRKRPMRMERNDILQGNQIFNGMSEHAGQAS